MMVQMMGVDAGGVTAGQDAWRHVRAAVEELASEGTLDATTSDELYRRFTTRVERTAAEFDVLVHILTVDARV
jgi:hypothetical protein